MRKLLPLLWVISLLSGCAPPATDPAELTEEVGEDGDEKADGTAGARRGCTATSPRTRAVEISIAPEAGEAPIAQLVTSATRSIRLMVYILDDGEILDALAAKAKDVSIELILDGNHQKAVNQDAFDRLTALGAEVHWADPQFSYMHA